MSKKSAGILVFRVRNRVPQFLLAHPGGPFWAKKDVGVWSIPKGEFDNEEPVVAAKREFQEEMGAGLEGQFIPLKIVKTSSGKFIHAFAVEAEFDASKVESNTFSMEWPPKSGMQKDFPEIDSAQWFSYEIAAEKIHPSQRPLLEEVKDMLERIKC